MVYAGPIYLEMAEEAWQTANNYTISLSQAQTGSIPSKNITFGDSCGESLAGGTFQQRDENNGILNVVTSGFFLIVSGLLGNATRDSTYLDAASLSFQFISTQLFNPITNEVMDSVDSTTCKTKTLGTLLEAAPALFLEGATILGNVTGNDTTKAFANNFAQNSINNAALGNSQGIIQQNHVTVAAEESGGHFIRALTTVYNVNTIDKALQDYIRAFIAVQYNAVVDLAGNADIYSDSWSGPTALYDFSKQTTAIDVLLSVLVVGNSTESSTPPPTKLPTPSHHKNVGAIVGGTIGGIILLITITLVLLLLRRRRRNAAAAALPKPLEEPSQGSILSTSRHDTHRNLRVKHPMPPGPSSSTTQTSRAPEETSPVVRDCEEAPGITISALMWQFNELLRRRSHGNEEETPPVYSGPPSPRSSVA